MTEIIETAEDERFRVLLKVDPEPSNPRTEYDNLGHVVTVSHSHYADVDEDGGPLAEGWDRLKDRDDAMDVFERWARVFHGAVVVRHTPHRGPNSLWYLMPEQFSEVTDPAAYLNGEIETYQAWAEGEVYGWVIEEKKGWTATDGSGESMETWEEVDSCWGLIGHQYAEDEAKAQLADFLKNR